MQVTVIIDRQYTFNIDTRGDAATAERTNILQELDDAIEGVLAKHTTDLNIPHTGVIHIVTTTALKEEK